MKSTLILSTIAIVALSTASAAPANPASQWCAAFSTGCKNAALSVCGGNNTSQSKCDSEFQGATCKSASVSCNCTPTGGSPRGAVNAALQNTFALTGGACSNLDFSNPDPPTSPTSLPPTPEPTSTTDGAVPPPTGVPKPNPTSAPAPPSSAVATPSASTPGATASNPSKSGAAQTKAGAVAMVATLAGVAMAVL
ncbi:hypothetical protein BG003_011573 [Podila horticola]|nr:hypothetical protein BG003_011573 [Podila horticola]